MMAPMIRRAWILAVALWFSAALHAQVHDFSYFARQMADPDWLTHVDYVATRLESSFDRTGGNNDGFNPERLKDNVYTIADLKGPGVVRRFYTAKPVGQLRIYIDDNPRPMVDMPAEEFFSSRHQPFTRPATGPGGGANYSYFPIPYAKSIRVQTTPIGPPTDSSYGFYYQVTYNTFPDGTPIRSLRLPLRAKEAAVWAQVQQKWQDAGRDPRDKPDGQQTVEYEAVIKPGSLGIIADIPGPATIEGLHLTADLADPGMLRSVLLKMRWDNQRMDAVNVPLGDFFGNGFSQVPYRALMMGLTEDRQYYCYFAMPFATRGRVALVNEGAIPLPVRARVTYRKTPGMPAGTGHFYAKWRREHIPAVNLNRVNTTGEHNYRVADAHGSGRLIGLNLNVFSNSLYWWGEGDPMIFIDNEPWPPGYHGTGTEEFFNDAYGFHKYRRAPGADPKKHEQNAGATAGVILPGLAEPASCYGGNAVYAFHLADSLTFRERIVVTFEHGTANNRTNDYASTAYWYAAPGARDFFVMAPAAERAAVPPDRWPAMRQELMKRSLPNVQRRFATIAEEIRKHPTDASLYKSRMDMLWPGLMVPGEDELSNDDRARLQAHAMSKFGRPPKEQWEAIDEVLLELAARLAPHGK